jgi:histone-lysine N-methyltransferase SETMAR
MLKPKHWIHSPNRPRKFKQMCAKKLMATVFWDRKGVLMVEFMQQGTTITSKVYCEAPKQLCRAIQNKRCGMLTSGIVLLHNARPHITASTRALLEHFNWDLFDHLPYSHDLALSNYHLFTYLKNWLESQCFNSNELTEGVKTWLSSQAADFFDIAHKNLFPDTSSASIPAVTTLRSSLHMYIFLYIIIFFSLLVLLTAHWRLLSEQPSY